MRVMFEAPSARLAQARRGLRRRLVLVAFGVLAIAAGVECWARVPIAFGAGIWLEGLVALLGSELIVGGTFLLHGAGRRRRWASDSIVAFAVAAAGVTLAVLAIQYWLAGRPWQGMIAL